MINEIRRKRSLNVTFSVVTDKDRELVQVFNQQAHDCNTSYAKQLDAGGFSKAEDSQPAFDAVLPGGVTITRIVLVYRMDTDFPLTTVTVGLLTDN